MLNQITLMGRLVRDPELRRTANGEAVTSFSLAVDRDFGKERETDFIDCVAWRKTGEFVEKYFSKGNAILVSGRLQVRRYTDKNGNNRTASEVNCDHVWFAGSKQDGGSARAEESNPFVETTEEDPDLPF